MLLPCSPWPQRGKPAEAVTTWPSLPGSAGDGWWLVRLGLVRVLIDCTSAPADAADFASAWPCCTAGCRQLCVTPLPGRPQLLYTGMRCWALGRCWDRQQRAVRGRRPCLHLVKRGARRTPPKAWFQVPRLVLLCADERRQAWPPNVQPDLTLPDLPCDALRAVLDGCMSRQRAWHHRYHTYGTHMCGSQDATLAAVASSTWPSLMAAPAGWCIIPATATPTG